MVASPQRIMAMLPLFFFIFSLAGCSPNNSAFQPKQECSVRIEKSPPTVVTAPEQQSPRSAVIFDVRVEVPVLLGELERVVPRSFSVSSEVKDTGQLQLEIERERFLTRQVNERVELSLALLGRASLCRSLGPLGCLSFARCEPAAKAFAIADLRLDEHLELRPVDVGITVTQPCTMSTLGVDITEKIQAEANQRAAEIRDQINAARPSVAPTLRSILSVIATPVPVGHQSCLRVRPKHVVQASHHAGEERSSELTTLVGVEGEISLETPCRAIEQTRVLALPPLRFVDALSPGIDLHPVETIAWSRVDEAIARSLQAQLIRSSTNQVTITDVSCSASVDGRLRLDVSVVGTLCGTLSFDAEVMSASTKSLRLREVRGVSESLPSIDERFGGLATRLRDVIENNAEISLIHDVGTLPRRLNDVAQIVFARPSETAPHQPIVQFEVHSASVDSVHVGANGVVLTLGIKGHSSVTVR